jgi:hypothetical protein
VNSVAIAIDWSMRVNVRFRKSRSSTTGSLFSASAQICAIASTTSTGYLPAAVSAESITASVPSSTAFATSLTSARVGTGLWIIDSIICVAVIVSLLRSRASRIIRFCSPGTAALPTSTARSPRATMIPSDASMISSSAGIASARSIFAIRSPCPFAARRSWRAMYMSSLFFGNDTAR